jgi:hypothetical protein
VATTSTTALAVSPQPSVTNQTVTLMGTVTAGPGSVRPSGTISFLNGGRPIGGCNGVPVSPTGQAVTIVCQASFPATAAQLSAVGDGNFLPSPRRRRQPSSLPARALPPQCGGPFTTRRRIRGS